MSFHVLGFAGVTPVLAALILAAPFCPAVKPCADQRPPWVAMAATRDTNPWNGTNGLTPETLGRGVQVWKNAIEASQFCEDTPDHPGELALRITIPKKPGGSLREWVAEKPEQAREAMTYFARCALKAKSFLRFQYPGSAEDLQWEGYFGFLEDGIRSGSITVDSQRRFAACLLTMINVLGTHQYISVRHPLPGQPIGAASSPLDALTMGYAEGVFVAEVLAHPASGFTLSLNLPSGWKGELPVPPNAVLGRPLDFQGFTWTDPGPPPVTYRLATWLGKYNDNLDRFSPKPQPWKGGDYDYPGALCPEAPMPCQAGDARAQVPFFVFAPHIANLEKMGWKEEPIQVTHTGTFDSAQNRECDSVGDCVGQVEQVRGPLTGFSRDGPCANGCKLVGLKPGQTVQAVFPLPRGPVSLAKEDFTAIVRFSLPGAGPGRARVEVSRGSATSDQEWEEAGTTWPERTGAPYRWLQVYPVRAYVAPDGTRSLRVRISGIDEGAAPELDAVAFVPGKPWCIRDPKKLRAYGRPDFFGTCE